MRDHRRESVHHLLASICETDCLMNTDTRTLALPGSARLVGPMREIGASALDRRAISWNAPDPADIVLDPWGPPPMSALVAANAWSPWAAPLASTRMTESDAEPARLLDPPHHAAVPISTVEPMHAVSLPDLVALAREQGQRPLDSYTPRSSIPSKPIARRFADDPVSFLPRPTSSDLVRSDRDAELAAARKDQSGASGRLLAAVVVGVALCAALGAALSTLV